MRGQYGQLQTVIFTILGLFCASTLPFCVDSSAIAQTPIATTTCTTEEINEYIKKLGTSEPNAFDALVACKSKAVPALVKELDNNDEKTRILIISALGAIGEHSIPASERLSQLLTQDKRRSVRVATIEALTEFGTKEAIPALNNALKDKDWYVSSTASRAIEKISNSININRTRVITIKIGSHSVGTVTHHHFQKPPVMCRVALIRAMFQWKCPSVKWQNVYTKK